MNLGSLHLPIQRIRNRARALLIEAMTRVRQQVSPPISH
jgi:hypothetical protein